MVTTRAEDQSPIQVPSKDAGTITIRISYMIEERSLNNFFLKAMREICVHQSDRTTKGRTLQFHFSCVTLLVDAYASIHRF